MKEQESAFSYWDFPASLKSWMQPFENWQKVENNPFMIYAKSLEVMFVPNPQMQKQMTEMFPKMWNPIDFTNVFALPYTQEKKSTSSGFESAKNFNENWQNQWSTFGTDLFKWYIEFFQKITDFWMNLWKK